MYLAWLAQQPAASPEWERFTHVHLQQPTWMASAVQRAVRGRRWTRSPKPWAFVAKLAREQAAEFALAQDLPPTVH